MPTDHQTEVPRHRNTGKWRKPDVPHRGWICIGVEDLEEATQVCEMCETQTIRYVHTMTHPEYDTLEVGCICAGHMEEDYVGAQRRADEAHNASRRRAAAAKREAERERQIAMDKAWLAQVQAQRAKEFAAQETARAERAAIQKAEWQAAQAEWEATRPEREAKAALEKAEQDAMIAERTAREAARRAAMTQDERDEEDAAKLRSFWRQASTGNWWMPVQDGWRITVYHRNGWKYQFAQGDDPPVWYNSRFATANDAKQAAAKRFVVFMRDIEVAAK